jgi:hypothetical protein
VARHLRRLVQIKSFLSSPTCARRSSACRQLLSSWESPMAACTMYCVRRARFFWNVRRRRTRPSSPSGSHPRPTQNTSVCLGFFGELWALGSGVRRKLEQTRDRQTAPPGVCVRRDPPRKRPPAPPWRLGGSRRRRRVLVAVALVVVGAFERPSRRSNVQRGALTPIHFRSHTTV